MPAFEVRPREAEAAAFRRARRERLFIQRQITINILFSCKIISEKSP